MNKASKKQIKINEEIVYSLIFAMTPIIASGVLMLIKQIALGYVAFPGIKWNDEAAYIKLIQTYSHYLVPRGYWGFDGNHALVGTGSAWNAAIIAPYAIFGTIIPVGSSFVYFCNMFYITAANVLLLILTKPDKMTKIKLILAELTGTTFLLYLNTNMSEIFRFALTVVLVGFLYKVYFDECPKWLKYVVIPLFIVYTVQVYTFFAFSIPVYVFAILKKRKLWEKIIYSIGAMGFIACGSYVLLHLVSSNYNIAKTEKLLNAVSEGNILAAAKSFAGMVKDGLIGLFNIMYTVYSNGIYLFHLMFAALITIAGLRQFFSKKSDKKDKTIGLVCGYGICIFFFMYMTLYTIVPDTFLRGTEIAVLFALLFMMFTKDKWLAWTLIRCNATSLLFLPANLHTFQGDERYYAKEERMEWKELENNFSEALILDKKADPWENTILVYTMEPRVIAAIPAGFGVNFVMNEEYVPNDAGYMLFTKHEVVRSDWIETFYSQIMNQYGSEIASEYQIIYEDDEYVIYKKLK